MKEDYPGQAYFHNLNPNIRRAEETWKANHEKVFQEVRRNNNNPGSKVPGWFSSFVHNTGI